jgi:hypothetical protein
MTAEFRVFLSAVTSEFGAARDGLAADLRSRDTLVRVQSDFRQEADSDTTLKKLHDYIRDCSTVVCVIGTRSRACPPPVAAAPFREMLRRGFRSFLYAMGILFRGLFKGRDAFLCRLRKSLRRGPFPPPVRSPGR